jgi:DNA replication protein DnaC
MERLLPPPIHKEVMCSKCGRAYSSKLVLLNGKYIEITNGICEECFKLSPPEEYEILENQIKSEKRRQWRNSVLPSKFIGATFNTLKPRGNLPKAIKDCQKYADEFPLSYKVILDGGKGYPSLMLTGNYGVGKTHLACAIINQIIDRWDGENITCPIVLVSEPDIYRQIQATYSFTTDEKQQRDSEADIIRRLVYIPLLIIDDIGKEQRQDTRFVQRILFSIIDSRYRLSKPIIVTTNLSADELDSYMGGGTESASYDRLAEMCKGNMWFINTTSYRKLE